jgi:prolyl oligopeptidase
MRTAPALWIALIVVQALPAPAGGAVADLPEPPAAPKRTVVDTYWGVKVEDDYQYMEQQDSPEVRHWAEQENDYARAWLDGKPERKAILDRVVALTHSTSPKYHDLTARGLRFFAMKEQPPKEQPFLVALPNLSDLREERIVVDPNEIDPTGGTAIDWYAPSVDGSRVAVSLSRNGTEEGTLCVYEAATGRKLPDEIPGVNNGTAGGSATWNADGTALYYTRCPRAGERPPEDLPFFQQIWLHRIGTPDSSDTYVLGREFPKIAEVQLQTSEDGGTILAQVENGDGGEYEYWIRRGDAPWKRIARFGDLVLEARIGPDGAVYLLSRQGAPRRQILRLPPGAADVSKARILVPESQAVIESYVPAASRLYVVEMLGGPTRVRIFDLKGRSLGVLPFEEVADLSSIAHVRGDDVVIRAQTYLTPPAYYTVSAGERRLVPTALAHHSPADYSDCEVRREFATADDGTKIPVNIILRRGTPLDGTAPTLLYAYGSYGASETPEFSASRRLWLEQGGIYVDASVRGGGEFGDAWHRAASLEKKRVSMDDLAACARHLVRHGYTSRERLAITGGSAGGLLVYGTMVHHPDLMSAVVARVGYGDVLRTELSPNGEFNTTEFGTVRNEKQFHGMYAYSPYHRVVDGRGYPSVLALTGLNDPRVEPWQSFKMVARLQASGTKRPVLLRVSRDTGHGIGTSLSEEDQQLADEYTFLFDQLRATYRPIESDGGAAPSP